MEYQALVKIPKEMLVKPLYYSYYVIRNGDEIVNEHIYNHASSECNFRTLFLEQSRKRGINIFWLAKLKSKEGKYYILLFQ
jgi:hypothetical protein